MAACPTDPMRPPASSPSDFSPPDNGSAAGLRDVAAQWIVRRDRGLSAAEQAAFQTWLAADPRHAAAVARSERMWRTLDRVPAEFTQPAPTRPAAVKLAPLARMPAWRWAAAATALAAAAAFAFIFRPGQPAARSSPELVYSADAGVRTLTLPDGSTVWLNVGASLQLQFTAAERSVSLTRGEAHFAVAKNPARPFVVHAGALSVRAVGTAFNVLLQSTGVEVLVTEGRVSLATLTNSAAPATSPPASALGADASLVEAGQRAVLATPTAALRDAAPALVVSRVDEGEIARALAWQSSLLRLGGATLAEVAQEFERRTGQRVVLADPALAAMRVGGRFRADDIEGFTHLLATTFEIEVERAADGTIVLRKKNSVSR